MRATFVMIAISAVILFFMLIVPSLASSQEILKVEHEGMCKEFDITVTGTGLGESCWDVKLDVPGDVYDQRAREWKSAFFYIEKGICFPDDHAIIIIKLDSLEPLIEAKAKLRQGANVIEKDFTIRQSCTQPISDLWVLLIAIAIILIFGWGLAWWWKRAK